MKPILFLFLILAGLTCLACGDRTDKPGPVEEHTVPLEYGAEVFHAPIGPNRMAKVRQHPKMARQICQQGCEAIGATMHKVGPTPKGWQWECLCAAYKENTP